MAPTDSELRLVLAEHCPGLGRCVVAHRDELVEVPLAPMPSEGVDPIAYGVATNTR